MSAFVAIVADTWRQSVQQVVFLIMIGLVLLVTAIFVVLPQNRTDAEGRQVMAMMSDTQPGATYERLWDGLYTELVNRQIGTNARTEEKRKESVKWEEALRLAQKDFADAQRAGAPPEQMDEHVREIEATKAELAAANDLLERERRILREEAGVHVEERKASLTPLEQGVHFWLDGAIVALYWASLLGFIAAGAGFFPGLLQTGSVDVVLSRPISRLQVFGGKYIGGIILYTIVMTAAVLVLYFAIGIRLGVWHGRLFLALPVMVFSAALLYAIVALIGIRTRSTSFAMGLGYFFLVVVDWALALIQAGALAEFSGLAWLRPVADVVRVVFPNFRTMQFWSSAVALGVPIFEWPLFLTAFAWFLICLAWGYHLFHKADY